MMSKKKQRIIILYLEKLIVKILSYLIRQKALGRIDSEGSKLKMSRISSIPVNIYVKCSFEGFKIIGSFVSIRRAGKFSDISSSSTIKNIWIQMKYLKKDINFHLNKFRITMDKFSLYAGNS